MSYEAARSLLNRSISRPTLYSVRMPNTWVSNRTNQYLDFFCNSTAIPEARVDTIAVPGHDFMGIVREQPVAMMFGKPLTLSVVENSDFLTYRELKNWLNATTVNANQNQVGTYGRSQRMRYYDTYTADIQILKLEQAQNNTGKTMGYREVMRVNFINAYPLSVSPIRLNSEAVNEYTTFEASFTYESYSVTYDGKDTRSVPQGVSSFIGL